MLLAFCAVVRQSCFGCEPNDKEPVNGYRTKQPAFRRGSSTFPGEPSFAGLSGLRHGQQGRIESQSRLRFLFRRTPDKPSFFCALSDNDDAGSRGPFFSVKKRISGAVLAFGLRLSDRQLRGANY
jgi:hypothetical protein